MRKAETEADFPSQFDVTFYKPRPLRPASFERRERIRRQVVITRLMQQGLTRYEAEEQWEHGLR